MDERQFRRILMIDDDEDDYLLAKAMLKQSKGFKIELVWVTTYEQGSELIDTSNFDAVLVDYDLGKLTGIDLIREKISQGCTLPLILFTGRGSYEVDLEALQAGATLYLTKEEANPLLLERIIRYAIERKHLEDDLRRERELLRKIIDSAPIGIAVIEGDDASSTRISASNEKAKELLGHSGLGEIVKDENFLSKGFHADGHPYLPEEWPIFRALHKGELAADEEIILEFPEGKNRTMRVSAARVLHGDSVIASVVVFDDITEQLRMENHLLYQAQVLEHVHDAILATDNKRRITAWNKAAEELYGWTAEEALGKIPGELLGTKITNEQREEIFTQVNKAGYQTIETAQRTRDGREVFVEISVISIKAVDGTTAGYVSTIRDVTTRKQIEAELWERNNK
jgi:PAS domain S-box-containing protein